MILMEAVVKAPNRLINEKSPYLLQHAYNPVDWYPWGEEAFETARREDKPVFLSVGYSTCHWCHVMERESFEDDEVADVLNRHFVSVKLDREERPDIDSVYMNVVQSLSGNGGWPMSVFMDCDKRPFFAGTYFPKNNGAHGLGFITLLERLIGMWQNDRPRLAAASREIIEELAEPDRRQTIDLENVMKKCFANLCRRFDSKYGGFGFAPKFPTPHNIMFLLRFYTAYGESAALEMAEKSLASMYRGGIYDHVGYGFARYSTDERWLVPHFEKMLYDNAMLAAVYAEAYQLTKKPFYKRIAEEIFEYIHRDMTAPKGAFFSAEDADSEGVEGLFYTFTKDELVAVLGESDADAFIAPMIEAMKQPRYYPKGRKTKRYDSLLEIYRKPCHSCIFLCRDGFSFGIGIHFRYIVITAIRLRCGAAIARKAGGNKIINFIWERCL